MVGGGKSGKYARPVVGKRKGQNTHFFRILSFSPHRMSIDRGARNTANACPSSSLWSWTYMIEGSSH
jgi:hypothetical protein